MSRFALAIVGLVTVGATRAQTPTVRPTAETQTGHEAALERRIALRLNRVSLATALDTVANRARVHLLYSWSVVPVDQSVSLTADSITVRDALALLLRGTGVEAVATSDATIMLMPHAQAPRDTVATDTTGSAEVLVEVVDSIDGHQVKGATVWIAGTKFHGISNDGGDVLMINVPAGRKTIKVRYVGYTPQERRVIVPDTGRVIVTVVLKAGMAQLQEVVTTATGNYRRYDIANDVTILNADSIVATQPISTVTDLIEGRVPNLSVQHTSGTPGDPSRIRIRGASSALLSNDPVLIVDGIRVYAAQSDSLSGNLATGLANSNFLQQYAAPSPLDQIDPHTIETLEVLSGPSAATMYGPDAANGVIVITTKKGRPGPARWDVSAYTGTSVTPGNFPTGYFRFGHNYTGASVLCVLGDVSCQPDSLVKFQILNDKAYTVIRPGVTNGASLTVSGGSTPDKNGSFLTYSFTGSSDGQSGNIGLPQVEIDNFETLHQGQAPPQWMRHPDHYTDWAARGSLSAHIGNTLDLSYTSAIQHRQQQRSDLESQLGTIMTTYVNPATHTYYQGGYGSWGVVPTLAPDFYQRITFNQSSYLNSGTAVWHPAPWLQGTLTGGINDLTSQDDVLEPANMLPVPNNLGAANTAHGTTTEKTVTAGLTARSHLWWKFRGDLGVGVNYQATSVNATGIGVVGLAPNATSIVGAQNIVAATEAGQSLSSFGWYVAPNLWLGDIDLSPGFRLDNSSAFGQNARTPLYPKIGLSIPIAQDRWFPLKRVFDDLRLRFAYGQAGVWPSPQMKLRLYQSFDPTIGGTGQSATVINQLGNTKLRPERSDEIELGFDAQLFNNLFSLNITAYRKMRHDAIMSVPLPPSVYGSGQTENENIGTVRNTGFSVNASLLAVDTRLFGWQLSGGVSVDHNMVLKLGPGVLPFGTADNRVIAGYPLNGRWAYPILGYSDANHDRIITANEVLLGDTLVYMGPNAPSLLANMVSNFSLFSRSVTISLNFNYDAGTAQENLLYSGTLSGVSTPIFARGLMDPSAPLEDQAKMAVTGETNYGAMQVVNALRFQSASISYHVPRRFASRWFHASALAVRGQATNLGLWTNYRGKDPNVNAFATGEGLADNGVLPLPRIYRVEISLTY